MVIVIVEIISGFFYYIGYEKQEQEQDETIWAFLKFGSLFAFCSFILIELVMWAQVSTAFNILESLGMSNDNFFSNYINYFLMALGIGIGLIEFFLGVITSKYRSSKGDSSLISSSRFLIVTIGLIILIYIPSVFLVFLGGVFAILVFLIQTLTLLGDYIIEKLSFKKNN